MSGRPFYQLVKNAENLSHAKTELEVVRDNSRINLAAALRNGDYEQANRDADRISDMDAAIQILGGSKKHAYHDPFAIIAGMASGVSGGRNAAGAMANKTAPKGERIRAQNIARSLAYGTSLAGGLAGLILARKKNPQVRRLADQLFGDPMITDVVSGIALPAFATMGGSLAAGYGTGLAVGGAKQLAAKVRGFRNKEAAKLTAKPGDRKDIMTPEVYGLAPFKLVKKVTDKDRQVMHDKNRANRNKNMPASTALMGILGGGAGAYLAPQKSRRMGGGIGLALGAGLGAAKSYFHHKNVDKKIDNAKYLALSGYRQIPIGKQADRSQLAPPLALPGKLKAPEKPESSGKTLREDGQLSTRATNSLMSLAFPRSYVAA